MRIYHRVILKIGSKVLSNPTGDIDEHVLAYLVSVVAELKKSGVEVILISSGAVSLGREVAREHHLSIENSNKRVFAAIGQVKLMETYARLFAQQEVVCAQVLVTKEDFRDHHHYHNMRECLLGLLHDSIIPIVNENDVISNPGVVFTDNDELAGLIAAQVEADAVLILTSAPGVLDADPLLAHARVIPELRAEEIPEIEKGVSHEKTDTGTGGMITKLRVARRLALSGISVHIIPGKDTEAIEKVFRSEPVGTHVIPARKLYGVKRRLAYAEGFAVGSIVMNEQASNMLLEKNKAMSILPVGVIRVDGSFRKNDIVEVLGTYGVHIGFGIAALDAEELRESIGMKGAKPAVHYDYLLVD